MALRHRSQSSAPERPQAAQAGGRTRSSSEATPSSCGSPRRTRALTSGLPPPRCRTATRNRYRSTRPQPTPGQPTPPESPRGRAGGTCRRWYRCRTSAVMNPRRIPSNRPARPRPGSRAVPARDRVAGDVVRHVPRRAGRGDGTSRHRVGRNRHGGCRRRVVAERADRDPADALPRGAGRDRLRDREGEDRPPELMAPRGPGGGSRACAPTPEQWRDGGLPPSRFFVPPATEPRGGPGCPGW